MAEEEKNEKTEETPEAEAPEEKPEAAAPEETPEAEAAEEAPAAEAAEEAPVADPEEGLDWKTRRRLERSRRSGEAAPARSVEERKADKAQRRAAAAKARSAYRRKRRQGGEAGQGTPPAERRSAGRKERQGRVVSNKSDKTITVRIDTARRHPAYEKIIRSSGTLAAHDERNEAGEGDLVKIVETRPLSRSKRWRLVEIMEKAR